jgi:hypothetical protein
VKPLAPRLFAFAILAALAGILAPACSLGEGKGAVSGELDIKSCWVGEFNLNPDFFAGVPYLQTSLIIRIQSGGDYQNFSDGLSILVDDVNVVRPSEDGKYKGHLGEQLAVSLPVGVTPPGVPIKANPDPALVHASLYLQRICRVQDVALYAVDSVSLNSLGGCGEEPTVDGAAPPPAGGSCAASGLFNDGGADAAAPVVPAPSTTPVGRSWIRFTHLSTANVDEPDASKRKNDADFEFFLADPREICPGGGGPPPPCRGHLKGSFSFFLQRGKPAQPFP